MGKPVSKKSILLSLDPFGQFLRECPDAVTNNEKYGKQVRIDYNTWEDGSESISAYNKATKKSVNLGKVFPPRDFQGGGQAMTPQQASAEAQSTIDDGLPF